MSNLFLRVLRQQVLLVVGVAFGAAAYLTAVPTSAEFPAFLPPVIFVEEDADMVAAYGTRHRTRNRTHGKKASTSRNSKGRVRRKSSTHRRRNSRRLSRRHGHRRLSKEERRAMRKTVRLWKRHYKRASTKVFRYSAPPQTIDPQLGGGEGYVAVLDKFRSRFGRTSTQSDPRDDVVGESTPVPVDGQPTLEMGPGTPLGIALTPVRKLLELEAKASEGDDVQKEIATEVLKIYSWTVAGTDLGNLKADGETKASSITHPHSDKAELQRDLTYLRFTRTFHYSWDPLRKASDVYAELRLAGPQEVSGVLEQAKRHLLVALFGQFSEWDENIEISIPDAARGCWEKILESDLKNSLFDPQPGELVSTLQRVYVFAAQHYKEIGEEFNTRVAGHLMYHLGSSVLHQAPLSVMLAFRVFSLALFRSCQNEQ